MRPWSLTAAISRLLLAAAVIGIAHLPAQAQQDSSTPPQNPPAPSAGAGAPAPSQSGDTKKPADENAFPEEQSRTAASKSSAAPPAPTALTDPAAQTGARPSTSAADNPFPEDVSRKAAADAATSTSAPTGVSSSASRDPDIDPDVDSTRQKLPKPSKNVAPGTLSGVAQAKEDTRVGNYYLDAGNWKGAYARFVEATRLDPANVSAVFGLAEAARHMGRAEEAAENYSIYLKVEPDGPKAKAAEKALGSLSAHK